MKKVALITGITGQDGSYLAEFLLDKDYDVHGVVRHTSTESYGRIDHLRNQVTLHKADLLDEGSLTSLVDQVQPDEFYNLAAMSFVPVSWQQPTFTTEVTGLGALRALEAIRSVNPQIRFYQASSSEMYGHVVETPQSETTRFYPRSPYAVAKVFAHHITVNYRESYGMYACSGILFNHESPRRGIDFVTRKITNAAARIKLGLQEELRLGNLDACRDWGFAGDYVEAMWLMLQQETADDFVIGTGETTRVGDFVDLTFDYLDMDPQDHVVIDPKFYRPAEVNLLLADPSKAKRQLGWEPKTDLRQLVAMMVEHDLALARMEANAPSSVAPPLALPRSRVGNAHPQLKPLGAVGGRSKEETGGKYLVVWSRMFTLGGDPPSMRQHSIRVAEPVLDGNERAYVLDCLDSTWISSRGKYIERFEAQMAEFLGVRHAVATNNGTTALHLALAAHDLRPGDEVIVPTLTYIASVNAIRYCGATPVFVDSVSPSMTLDPAQIEAKLTDRTRGIVSVPLYGHPVDWDDLQDVADRNGLFVVEDAAEALGARHRDRMVGAWGDCATFSFFGNKIITTGEGGMVVTDNGDLASRLRLLRGQAVSPDRCYWHNEIGFNYRMTNVAAAIGCAQMERIEDHLARRARVADAYFRVLESHRDLFQLPDTLPNAHHCYWMYSVVIHPDVPVSRDDVMAELAKSGIETRPVFYPVHWMPPYQEPRGSYPVAEEIASRGISLPTHGKLTDDDVHDVAEQLVYIVERLVERKRTTRKAA